MRSATVKEATKAHKHKTKSPFIHYCMKGTQNILIAGAAIAFMALRTDTIIKTNFDTFNNHVNRNNTTVEMVIAQVTNTTGGVGDGTAEINAGQTTPSIPGVSPDQVADNEYQDVVTDGGGVGCHDLVDGWLQLYDGPTVKSDNAYEVEIPLEANGVNGGYTSHKWSMGEGANTGYNKYIIQQYTDQTHKVGPGGVGRVNSTGRYWVALGPSVTNRNFHCDSSGQGAGAGEWDIQDKRVDVVLKSESDGKIYYLPVVLGDAKAHCAPTGIVQTGLHVHGTENCTGNNDKSIVEFTYVEPSKAAALSSKFEIQKMIVYPKD